DEFIVQARKFIAANRDRPFFLYFSSQDIHVPRTPHPRFKGASELGYRGDAMVQLDWSTGEILKVLDELGLADDTIVIFSSDNGPTYDDGYVDGTTVFGSSEESDRGHDGSGIYRGGKYKVFEGGTRVPLMIRWPGHITPGTSAALVNQIDFLASFASLLGIGLDASEARDSRDTLQAFLGTEPNGLDFMLEESDRRIAIRKGNWKYIQPASHKLPLGQVPGPEAALYDLTADPGESVNVIADHPELARELADRLAAVIAAGRIRP
ncbi:MAG TPA: sulfatase-like hydrolase/transferase, partial [Oceanipulchritudo sp.]|nr:sulfatase-like hydrolase/transferase [Oceanipulchritudo sp.]